MDISEFICNIQAQIGGKTYEDYAPAFREYEKYLKQRQREKSNIVAVTCQLAAVSFELRYEITKSIQMLEALLLNTAVQLTPSEKARIYTNLAFYYEENCDKENCFRCLKEAVSLNPGLPNAYDALGRFYIKNGDSEIAIPFLKRACGFSDKVNYQYNYGVALFSSGDIVSAKEIFIKLLPNAGEKRCIPYAYGVCCALTGDIKNSCKIADDLAVNVIDDYITSSEVADLYFLCAEYAKHNKMYDNDCYSIDVRWIAPYLYSLKALDNLERLVKKYEEFISEADCAIEEAMAEELDETYTQQDKADFIEKRKSEKDEIVQAYHEIINTKYKPQLKVNLWCICECYMVDCPRHQGME